MEDNRADQPVLNQIQRLVTEEHQLYEGGVVSDGDQERLDKLKIELDQCWDLLRQRRALRDAGRDPNEAHTRPADVVEKYQQ